MDMTLLISHVPKTAGSSLRALVTKFNPDTVFVYEGRELALGNPNIEFIRSFRAVAAPRVVMGHFSYGVHRLIGTTPSYATVLREPVERVVSFYRFQKSLPHSPFAAHFKAGISLSDFVRSEITETTNNHMCRMIAGIPPEAGLLINDQWLLDLALHNLRRHYVLVGMVEKLDLFVSEIARWLGWGPFEIPRENQTQGDVIELTPEDRAAVTEANRLDIALFEHAMRNYG
jgi:hypothetical protein